MDSIQKARIKWDVEGDENSKFFHNLINKKRRHNSINGIMHEGNWVTDPQQIKEVILNFFKFKFQANDSSVEFPSNITSSRLDDCDRDSLEAHVSIEEIKMAVWGGGSEKAPDPDGYTFAFMPPGSNSSFITLIPKVSKSILIIDFRPISLIGFGLIWRSWIKACLESSRTSVLVNGSPTSEFNVRRGLRQGDPLSLFLFIIIMEGLHAAISDSMRNGLIQGIEIGSFNVNLSHLFFVDDVIITSE
ncbi:RNA-directed DNA polymerase, eukaryota [Tanacetum coccineum]